MPGGGPMTTPCDLAYLYDGSLAGFYCCVYESVYSRRQPLDILPEEESQPTLLIQKRIDTDLSIAQRVRKGIERKCSLRSRELIEAAFLSCLAQKELSILRYLLLAFREGRGTPLMLAHPDVAALLKAEKYLLDEQHLLTGFIRFAEYEGALVATISPKNFVLPYLAEHFIDRFANETFMIYDRTHRAALIYQHQRAEIVQMEQVAAFTPTEEELRYQALWKQFYKTIGIAERENSLCRMSHMPKRYWENMTEMKDLL